MKNSVYPVSLLEQAILKLESTFAVFKTKAYILNTESKLNAIVLGKRISFVTEIKNIDPNIKFEIIHKKAVEIINKDYSPFIAGYLFDENSILDRYIIPKEIIQLIVNSNFLLNFENFRSSICAERMIKVWITRKI